MRITTRLDPHDIGESLFSIIHEAGHAIYEQGVAAALDGTPLGSGASAGVHESQSRLWENVVGRGRGVLGAFLTRCCRRRSRTRSAACRSETFYRAINKVERSLIRTDADEVTYNLHIMMRFDLEIDLLEGRLRVKDLPQAWRARMESDLGVSPTDDRNGCLQDVHWYGGSLGGGFQGYTIGNILSAQFYAAAVAGPSGNPARDRGRPVRHAARLARRRDLYRHGRKFTPDELVKRATGAPMSIATLPRPICAASTASSTACPRRRRASRPPDDHVMLRCGHGHD